MRKPTFNHNEIVLRFLDTDVPFRSLRDSRLESLMNRDIHMRFVGKHRLTGYDKEEVLQQSDAPPAYWDPVMVRPFQPVKVIEEFTRTYKNPEFVKSMPGIGKSNRTLFNFDGRLMESGKKNKENEIFTYLF
jgi:hypothetical protein